MSLRCRRVWRTIVEIKRIWSIGFLTSVNPCDVNREGRCFTQVKGSAIIRGSPALSDLCEIYVGRACVAPTIKSQMPIDLWSVPDTEALKKYAARYRTLFVSAITGSTPVIPGLIKIRIKINRNENNYETIVEERWTSEWLRIIQYMKRHLSRSSR